MGSPSLPGSIFHASPPRSPSGLRLVASRCPCVLDRSTHDRACGMQWWHARGRWACRYRWICSHSCSRLQPGRHPFHHRARMRSVIGMTVYEDVCAVGRNAAGFAARARSRGTPSSSKSARKNLAATRVEAEMPNSELRRVWFKRELREKECIARHVHSTPVTNDQHCPRYGLTWVVCCDVRRVSFGHRDVAGMLSCGVAQAGV